MEFKKKIFLLTINLSWNHVRNKKTKFGHQSFRRLMAIGYKQTDEPNM